MNRAVLIGGFAENRLALDPVAEALIAVRNLDSVDILPFVEAMKYPRAVRLAALGQLVVTHSAGIMAIERDSKPNHILAYNGPEPRSVRKLITTAVRKTGHHLVRAAVGPDRSGYVRVVSSNTTELMVHPFGNLGRLKAISRFSTLAFLKDANSSGIESTAVVMGDDEFFGPISHDQVLDLRGSSGLSVKRLDGRHDDLLVDPKEVLALTATPETTQ